MARERSRRRSSIIEEFDTSLMYDDIEKIREAEEEVAKDQGTQLGAAGMMALVAGAGLLVTTIFAGTVPVIGDLFEALVPILSVIGYLALGYGFFKTMRLAFRKKELNFPALNVYRKTKPAPPPPPRNEEKSRSRTQDRSTENTYRSTRNRTDYRRAETYTTGRQKGLRRSRSNRVFSGVAGGIADYFGISAVLIRFAFIASLFASGGASIFVYLLLSMVLPTNYDDMFGYRGYKPGGGNGNAGTNRDILKN